METTFTVRLTFTGNDAALLADVATLRLALHYMDLPLAQMLRNELSAVPGDARLVLAEVTHVGDVDEVTT